MRKPWVAVLCLVLGSCGGTDGPGAAPQPGDDAGPGAVADAAASGDASADTGTPTTPCQLGARSCADSGHERSCRDVAGTPTWVDAACAEYSYCLTDRCVAACLDECALGDTRSTGAGQQTCRLLSSSGGLVSPGSGSHDLARKHLAWLRAHQLANGYIANTVFSDASHRTPIAYTGTVDAAEWTGLYLAAESLRALTTHSPDAIRNVEALVERIHQLFEITATPGYMARFWAPRSGDPLLAALYDPSTTQEKHIATSYRGAPAFYGAWTSIDMYQGVSLGLGLAYQVTASPSHRAMLRELVVTLVRELIKLRPAVPVRVRHKLLGSWISSDFTFDVQHAVLVPSEMVDGRVFIQVGTDADPNDFSASELRGVREFFPDFAPVLRQLPVVGPALPQIPRPGTAILLAYLMEMALDMTAGLPASAADRALIQAHYDSQLPTWLPIMKQYAYHHADNCWQQYFGLALVHHSTYGLLRQGGNPTVVAAVRGQVLADKLRPIVAGHRNAYFDFIAAAQGPAGLVPAGELATTVTQLAGFPPPPRASLAVDNSAQYPAKPGCANQSTGAVAIGQRVAQDFLWQHHPFRLRNEFVDARHVFPGADYLIAYWLGRQHGFISDDAPNTCTRWRGN